MSELKHCSYKPYEMYNTLCEYKGMEGNYLLPSIIIIIIIIPLHRILYTASFILVAPPVVLPLNSSRLNLHSCQNCSMLYMLTFAFSPTCIWIVINQLLHVINSGGPTPFTYATAIGDGGSDTSMHLGSPPLPRRGPPAAVQTTRNKK